MRPSKAQLTTKGGLHLSCLVCDDEHDGPRMTPSCSSTSCESLYDNEQLSPTGCSLDARSAANRYLAPAPGLCAFDRLRATTA